MDINQTTICPGCGRVYKMTITSCQRCGYENGVTPFRLLTISEILEDTRNTKYDDVNMSKFLRALFAVLEIKQ